MASESAPAEAPETGRERPIGKRSVPLSAATRALLVIGDPGPLQRPGPVSKALALRPGGIVHGPRAAEAVRVALAFAARNGFAGLVPQRAPDGAAAIEVDTRGLFDHESPARLGSLLEEALRHYAALGVPDANALEGRYELWVTLPESLMDEIRINAFASRRAAEVEAVATLEEAMRLTLAGFQGRTRRSERLMDAMVRTDLALQSQFRERASELGLDADTLLWTGAHEVAKRRGK